MRKKKFYTPSMINLNRKISNNGFRFEVAFPAFIFNNICVGSTVFQFQRMKKKIYQEMRWSKTIQIHIYQSSNLMICISFPVLMVFHYWKFSIQIWFTSFSSIHWKIHISLRFRLDFPFFFISSFFLFVLFSCILTETNSHSHALILFWFAFMLFKFTGRKTPNGITFKSCWISIFSHQKRNLSTKYDYVHFKSIAIQLYTFGLMCSKKKPGVHAQII